MKHFPRSPRVGTAHSRRIGLVGLLASLVAAIATAYACVPADTRPLPGTLTLTVSPSPAVADGVVTTDGWSVRFERVLLGIGQASLSDGCTRYSDNGYDRILDMSAGSAQKLSVLYGLGTCNLRFRISPPSSDALLGQGVTEADKTRMRTPGADAYVPLGGVSIELSGAATRGAITKRFHLPFRARVRYQNCVLDRDASTIEAQEPGVTLASNVDLTYDLRIEAEAIFRDNIVPTVASMRFFPFANADLNNDGEVTLDELRQVPIATVRDGGAFKAGTYEFDDAGVVRDGKPVLIETLGDYIYVVLIPTLPRFRGTGSCPPNISLGSGGGRRN